MKYLIPFLALFALAICLAIPAQAEATGRRSRRPPPRQTIIIRDNAPRSEILLIQDRRRNDVERLVIRRGPFGGEVIRLKTR